MEDTITIAFIVIIGFLAFVCYCIYHNRKQKRELEAKIRQLWGKRPEREYSYEEFDAISHYFQYRKKDGYCIDDITWNDLDMDTIFMLLNHTYSCIGESCLYAQLRIPSFSKDELEERNRLIRYFMEHKESREQLEYFFAKVGKTGAKSVFDYIYNLAGLDKEPQTKHFICIGGIFLSLALVFTVPQFGVLLLIAAMGYSWSVYFKEKKKAAPYIMSCNCLLLMLKVADNLEKIKIPEIESYTRKIKESRQKFSRFKRNSYFLIAGGDNTGGPNAGGGIEKTLIDYVNFTFHIDLIQFNTLIGELKGNLEAFEVLTENLGALESAMAVASFRTMMKEYCIPKLLDERTVFLRAENVYHPMIDEPVKNSVSVDRGVLLTGSNASGKSTFLKTVAINAILAQTIYTCMADDYEGNFYKIYTSMALKDDLMNQESYYIVEIKSLKRILDHMQDERPLLCFVDEVLRGTNTIERIAASSQILKSMARKNVLCFAATHDIELTHILEKYYKNYHFQEEIHENDILFNYKLYKGRAISRNAIKLLSIIGYHSNIISRAEHSAQHFTETGEWTL